MQADSGQLQGQPTEAVAYNLQQPSSFEAKPEHQDLTHCVQPALDNSTDGDYLMLA